MRNDTFLSAIARVHPTHLEQGKLNVQLLGRGFAWSDAGSYESVLEAANFVDTIEKTHGYEIACPGQIA